ncbi:Mth938-like domain-containing protein [Terrarubrum flagellatum]|uniref:Mth938-like domain-containing protein n=1 Tax=Terrirubrum flagellatum TaxID=2895980 RepID=UPI003144E2C0
MPGDEDSLRGRGFLPGQYPIDAYGDGGFRFGEMSHRGSILALPSSMRAWDVARAADFTVSAFAPVLAEAERIELLLIGTGRDPAFLPEELRWTFRDARIGVDAMTTAAAARTYNVLLAENRRVAAALIAV